MMGAMHRRVAAVLAAAVMVAGVGALARPAAADLPIYIETGMPGPTARWA